MQVTLNIIYIMHKKKNQNLKPQIKNEQIIIYRYRFALTETTSQLKFEQPFRICRQYQVVEKHCKAKLVMIVLYLSITYVLTYITIYIYSHLCKFCFHKIILTISFKFILSGAPTNTRLLQLELPVLYNILYIRTINGLLNIEGDLITQTLCRGKTCSYKSML